VNEAAFYILDGEGYEVHDGVRYDWKAGDIAIVHNNCVHQHFNASATKPARALVIKTKPMYMFMNMLFQQQVEPAPACPPPEARASRRARAKTISTIRNESRRRSRPWHGVNRSPG
jgi:gentisate 1,2-dioxygenase